MTPKQKWKAEYRLGRIYRRETTAAMVDSMAIGIGILSFDNNNEAFVKRISLADFFKVNPENLSVFELFKKEAPSANLTR